MSPCYFLEGSIFPTPPPTFSYITCEANDHGDKTGHYSTLIFLKQIILHLSFKMNTRKHHVTMVFIEWQHFIYTHPLHFYTKCAVIYLQLKHEVWWFCNTFWVWYRNHMYALCVKRRGSLLSGLCFSVSLFFDYVVQTRRFVTTLPGPQFVRQGMLLHVPACLPLARSFLLSPM